MYVIKARTHGCVRNDSETHSTGVTGLHSRLRRSCNPVTQSRAFHCHFAHTRAFSLYSSSTCPWQFRNFRLQLEYVVLWFGWGPVIQMLAEVSVLRLGDGTSFYLGYRLEITWLSPSPTGWNNSSNRSRFQWSISCSLSLRRDIYYGQTFANRLKFFLFLFFFSFRFFYVQFLWYHKLNQYLPPRPHIHE